MKMGYKPSEIDDIEIEDTTNNFYSSKEKGKKEIICTHFERCMVEGSKEMTEGGVTRRLINGRVEEFAVPNQMDIFINCIKMLWSALKWDIVNKYQKDSIKQMGNWSERYNQLKKEYNKSIEDLKVLERKGHNTIPAATYNKNNYEKALLELYREKFDFCIFVLEKENWFGIRDA
jgi:hypothetical protein